MEKKINATEKFCTRCGRKFIAVGREVICPECKAQAAEESKRAAVMRAKRASWNGESVPVRISGRASTLIRKYAAANGMAFAESLDDLLKASVFFQSAGQAWEDITPYKSRRRKSATEDEPQEVKQAAKQAGKATTSTTASKAAKTSKTAAGKKEGKKA